MLKSKLKIDYYLYKRITFIIPFLCNQSRDKTLKMTKIDMHITMPILITIPMPFYSPWSTSNEEKNLLIRCLKQYCLETHLNFKDMPWWKRPLRDC